MSLVEYINDIAMSLELKYEEKTVLVKEALAMEIESIKDLLNVFESSYTRYLIKALEGLR